MSVKFQTKTNNGYNIISDNIVYFCTCMPLLRYKAQNKFTLLENEIHFWVSPQI